MTTRSTNSLETMRPRPLKITYSIEHTDEDDEEVGEMPKISDELAHDKKRVTSSPKVSWYWMGPVFQVDLDFG